MNRLLICTIALLISACSFISKKDSTPPTIYEFSENITSEGLHEDLAVLAHDSLQGRETGTEGLQKAARYLADKYEKAGLVPVGENNSYFQEVEFIQPTVDKIEYIVTTSEGDTVLDRTVHSSEEIASFITLYGASSTQEGEIVFAGNGLVDEEAGINHLPEDVEGKWLLIIPDEQRTNMRSLQGVLQSGAAGIITVIEDENAYLQQATSVQSGFGQGGRLQLAYLQDGRQMQNSPAFNAVNPQMAATLLGLDDPAGIAELSAQISEDAAGFEPIELNYRLKQSPALNQHTVVSKNVVAFIEGTDPELKDEVVILSSHYDHVGVGRPDSTGDAIYNGADDDGSGTVATLHAALAMAQAKEAGAGPRRSVLFLHVTAEEKGLLGSRYYSDHPIFPIENTVANINIDMVGRVDAEHAQDSNYVYIIGGEIISSGLDSLTQVANEMGPNLKLSKRYNDLNDPNQFYRRSDHWNFGRLGVPFVFFFNGTHEDYHRPSDHIEKITFGPLTKRTQLVYNLTSILANSDERPVVDNQEFIERTQVQPR